MQFGLDALPGPLADLVADKPGEEIGQKKKNEDQAPGGNTGDLQDSKQYTYHGRSHNTKVFYFIKKLSHLWSTNVSEYDLLSLDLFPLQISFSTLVLGFAQGNHYFY
jgi:hypothetical protein